MFFFPAEAWCPASLRSQKTSRSKLHCNRKYDDHPSSWGTYQPCSPHDVSPRFCSVSLTHHNGFRDPFQSLLKPSNQSKTHNIPQHFLLLSLWPTSQKDQGTCSQHRLYLRHNQVMRSWLSLSQALSVGAIQRSLKLSICLGWKALQIHKVTQSTKKPYRATQTFLQIAMTIAKVGIVFNCRLRVLQVAVSVDCITNLTWQRYTPYAMITSQYYIQLHKLCRKAMLSPTRSDRREIWIPGALGCGQDRGTVEDFSWQVVEEPQKHWQQPAGSSFCEVICFPVGFQFSFPLIPLSRSDKIKSIHARVVIYVDKFFTPQKTRKRLENCNVFTNIVGKHLGRLHLATPWYALPVSRQVGLIPRCIRKRWPSTIFCKG